MKNSPTLWQVALPHLSPRKAEMRFSKKKKETKQKLKVFMPHTTPKTYWHVH
jgi:hypothetical protein